MASGSLIAAEISRFIASNDREVLCIKGKWGVGKTFAWRKYLSDAQSTGASAFEQYSYVSLFGLNTLDDLRYAILEGTVTPERALTGPDVDTFKALLKRGLGAGRSIISTALEYVGASSGGAAVAKAAFLLVRNQLICLDDLERAGSGLEQRDILGLVSWLKEQRNCKVVLLLNDLEMGHAGRQEFERLLEKVVDVSLAFEPTPDEAAAIALPGADDLTELIRNRVVQLNIVNIRVIKKIERFATRLSEVLDKFRREIREQAISTVTLGAWAVYQPGDAPSLDFLKSYNSIVFRMRQNENPDGVDDGEIKWKQRIAEYPFLYADDLDLLILDGVDQGFFDDQKLIDAASAIEAKLATDPQNNSFSRAWDLYHGSFTVEDDEVLNAMFAGAMENLSVITPVNINSAIKLFRESGREAQADEILSSYVEAHREQREFFDLDAHVFMQGDDIDPRLRQAFAESYSDFVDDREPREVLLKIALEGWNDADLDLLAGLGGREYLAIFDSIEGKNLGRAVKTALQLGGVPSEAGRRIRAAVEDALRQIAARSPMRARRVRQFGIDLDLLN